VQWSSCQRHSPRSAGTCSPLPAQLNYLIGGSRVSKKRSFQGVRFPASLVSDAYQRWIQLVDSEGPIIKEAEVVFEDSETHTFETLASWLDAYRRNPVACTLINGTVKGKSVFNYYFDPVWGSSIEVTLSDIDGVNELLERFEREAPKYRLSDQLPSERAPVTPPTSRPYVFVGYGGGSQAWRDLRDFLLRLEIEVETFQSQTRVGQTITDVLNGMLNRANFAFLVHTAEDDVGDGRMRARQNIVHETGLFQGRLGFDRAIIIREEGTEDFSNVHGLQEIRFPAG
jgi:hypothetical protein